MRVVKEAKERRNEILDAAERLFGTKGYDHTSTNDILNEVGIARGTLYYHFKSKEDILDAMIERITQRLIARARGIARQKEVPFLQRFTLVIGALNVDGPLGNEIMELVHKPQNALMHQKMQERMLSGVNPLITELVEEGIESGFFKTDYPAESVEMMMLYSNTAFDALAEHSGEEQHKKIDAFIYNVERLLGMKPGSMQDVIRPLLP